MKLSNGLFDEEIPVVPLSETVGHTWRSPAAQSLRVIVGTDDPTVAIRMLAQELVVDSGLSRPAENLALIASLQDIVEIRACDMEDAGRLLPTERGLVIHLNAAHSTNRRNFSAGHEICHTLIPSFQTGTKRKIDSSTGLYAIDAEEEYLCDLGASEILLPTAEFMYALGEVAPTIGILSALAAEFGASLEATAIKLVRLGCIDIGLIVWEPSLKPRQITDLAEPSLFESHDIPLPPQKLRIRYACCGGSMVKHFFPKSKSIEEESLVGRAFASNGSTRGKQQLMTGKGLHTFYTESVGFEFWNNNRFEKKVISLVFP